MNYYDEFDPKAAAWLRELIKGGHIAPGVVDERSIRDLPPDELLGFTQCHFFAGIGGWSLALRRAGWSDHRPVWTGSCPCQPFSSAGQGRGVEDPRHLWPVFRNLIAFAQPAVVFGEQVASAAGRAWCSGVRADLEGLAYAVGAADLCSAGVGSPNIRQRLYWVADSHLPLRDQRARGGKQSVHHEDGEAGGLGHPNRSGSQQGRQTTKANGYRGASFSNGCHEWMVHPNSERGCSGSPGIKDAADARLSSEVGDFWGRYGSLPCTDGKTRRIEPGSFPLAHGVPGRVGLLRGYGNAINPEVGATFIEAFMQIK